MNIYDNDEFDIMTKDTIDTTRIHKGKRKDKYKNINQLLNDKSHIAETKDVYLKYNMVTSGYDDEYDDTYDDQDIGGAQDDIEVEARPFTVPRILRKQEIDEGVESDEEQHGFDYQSSTQGNADQFVQDPALMRARAEERWQSKRGGRRTFTSSQGGGTSAVGNPKGQGQSKETTNVRTNKNKNKATRANHNRRAGAQWKHSRGMVPS